MVSAHLEAPNCVQSIKYPPRKTGVSEEQEQHKAHMAFPEASKKQRIFP